MRGPRGVVAGCLIAFLASVATTAQSAPPDEKKACLDAFVEAQKLRSEKKRDEARKSLVICSRSMCPKVAKEPCTQWLTEVDAELASPFVDVRDDAARKLADEGNAASERKDGATALDRFTKAEALSPAPSIELAIARTQASLGHFAASTIAYRRLASGSGAAAEAAKAELGAVEARAAHLTITVAGGASADIDIDGKSATPGADGDVVVDAGEHHVHGKNAAGDAAESTVKVAEGQTQAVTLHFFDPNASTGSGRRTAGYVAFGVAGGGLVVGGVFGALALKKHSNLESVCEHGCPPNEHSANASYKTMGLVSTIGFAVAGAAAVTGVVLVATSKKKAQTVGLSAVVGPASIDLLGVF